MTVKSLPLLPALIAAAPATLLAVTAMVVPRRATVALAWGRARQVTVATAVVAVAVAAIRAIGGERANAVVRLDNVTVAMLLLVALVGWVVARYSSTYLAGDPHERRYIVRLLATLAAVAVVVVANHLALLVAAWAAASVALHGLLIFFGDRPVAVAVAHKKFLLARAADACMIAAVVAFAGAFGTMRIDGIVAEAVAAPALPVAARVGIVLVAIAALLKCAQLPFHGWLIQVMEAPTPVSALLHAGVVNLGGFVLLRFAPVIDRSVEARTILVVVGALTAVVASLVMTTRVSAKVALAWSTCAQMGFMLVQCGLGLWEMALLHLLAHSVYKAHAFLGAGGVVRQTQRAQLSTRRPVHSVRSITVGAGVATLVTALVGLAWERLPFTKDLSNSVWVMMGVVALAVVPLAVPSRHASPIRLVGRSLAVPLAYVALHDLAALVVPAGAAAPVALVVVAGLGFALLFVAQTWFLVAPSSPLANRVRPWLYAGYFLDDAFTRVAFAVSRPPATRSRPRALPLPPTVTVVTGSAVARTAVVGPPAGGCVEPAIDAACGRIAPTWPLDQFIAVNPYWGWRQQPAADVAASLGVLAGTALTMPRVWFREEWKAGRLAVQHLSAAAAAAGEPALADAARAVLEATDELVQSPLRRLALVTDLRDLGRGPVTGRLWSELVVHQIGQHCAAHFDEWQATWAPDPCAGLFHSWRVEPSVTHGFRWVHGSRWARDRLAELPDEAVDAIAKILDDLGIPSAGHEAYLTANLASVNGWAAWCAYRRWQARLLGADDDAIVELLAVRLAWEWLLAADAETGSCADLDAWAGLWGQVDAMVAETAQQQRVDWVLQGALERTYQATLIGHLPLASEPTTPVDVQAVFCIDVRSEVVRRALESVDAGIRTRGFAGFFGLPISYTPAGSTLTRPQLPGLLAPAFNVSEVAATSPEYAEVHAARSSVLSERQRWASFRRDPSSVFSFVESMGLLYATKLVFSSLPHHDAQERWEDDGLDEGHRGRRPRLTMTVDDPAAAAAVAQRVLTAMGLVDGFAPLVMVCGHGSQSANNPHAAGLDCGACGGQTGEVNARVLADLLNDDGVRRELHTLGIDLPATTWFIPALHNTTTDTVELFDLEEVPDAHSERLAALVTHLRAAGQLARAERAVGLGLAHLATHPVLLEQQLLERANDWSQVRPEWGLAGNAAFIVAPRSRTRHLDLQGRSFLHDYDWRLDSDNSVLTLIMTAPMVVTNWINLQYHASTVDNRRYGSGNKVLHNVVGGRIGVFEGNGGDLRVGLSLQSLHDGSDLRHPPLRLSVFIEAPRAAIDAVIAEHAVVRDLVMNQWLHLLRIDSDNGSVERRTLGGWRPAAA